MRQNVSRPHMATPRASERKSTRTRKRGGERDSARERARERVAERARARELAWQAQTFAQGPPCIHRKTPSRTRAKSVMGVTTSTRAAMGSRYSSFRIALKRR